MKETGSQWRRELAEQAVAAYQSNPHVDAVILGGSTARNHADKFSDKEIGVFWHQPPRGTEHDDWYGSLRLANANCWVADKW